jgi:hypothetical protein
MPRGRCLQRGLRARRGLRVSQEAENA